MKRKLRKGLCKTVNFLLNEIAENKGDEKVINVDNVRSKLLIDVTDVELSQTQQEQISNYNKGLTGSKSIKELLADATDLFSKVSKL